MSSTEFWEDDPQLYWSYRIFYLKQREVSSIDLKYETWLKGMFNSMATSNAIRNNFSSQKADYPTFEQAFGDAISGENNNINKNEKITKKDIDKKIQNEFIAWARY